MDREGAALAEDGAQVERRRAQRVQDVTLLSLLAVVLVAWLGLLAYVVLLILT